MTKTELNEIYTFDAKLSNQHQISIEVIGTAPVGSTILLSGVPLGLTLDTSIVDSDTEEQVSFSLTDPDMIFVRGRWETFTITVNQLFIDDPTSTYSVNHNV